MILCNRCTSIKHFICFRASFLRNLSRNFQLDILSTKIHEQNRSRIMYVYAELFLPLQLSRTVVERRSAQNTPCNEFKWLISMPLVRANLHSFSIRRMNQNLEFFLNLFVPDDRDLEKFFHG